MLQDFEIERLFIELSLPEEGRELVRFARKNSPVRRANSRIGNHIVWQYSRKMGGKHLELESQTVESPAATMYEDDPAYIEYWPQPFTVELIITGEDEKIVTRNLHTPDFLLIRQDKIYIHEWRDESRLMGLAREGSQFFKDEGDRWHYIAAENFFSKIGLQYEVHSAIEMPRIFIQNVRFLEDYNLPNCPPLSEDVEAKLLKLLSERASIPFLELLHEHNYASDDIFKAIVKKSVAVDLYNSRLDFPSGLMIHRDMAISCIYSILNNDHTPALPIPGMGLLSAGARLKFNGKDYEIILVGGNQVLLRDTNNKRISLPLDDVLELFTKNDIDILNDRNLKESSAKQLANYSKEQIETGMKRLSVITGNNSEQVPIRTIQDWKGKLNDSMSQIDRIIALTHNNKGKGNREPRLSEKSESLAEEVLTKYFNTPECRTVLAAHLKYVDLCAEARIKKPMSYPTFTERAKTGKSIKKREGKRMEYQESEIPLFLDYRFPIHGVYPHEVLYADHTTLNLATIGPEGSELGKPTFSLGTDGHTTQTRAFYLSYDPPSAAVVLMLLRDYVRRHHRLPRILIVDGGREFRSKELIEFCRLYKIDLRFRRSAKPRDGTSIERALGATETEVIAQMKGNTRSMKNARMVTKSVNPFPNAEWTLTAAHGALEEYLFEIRETRPHPTLGLKPHDYEAMRMMETGMREHKIVKFDENIMLMTSPHTKRWYHTIDRTRGIWADNAYYWHDKFKAAKIHEKMEVRPEPWNANVVYVYFRDSWIAAIARDIRAFGGRTRREVEIALRAERRLAKVNSNKFKHSRISAKKMVGLWSPEKFDERIGRQQREMTHLYSRLGMTTAMKVDIPAAQKMREAPTSSTEKTPSKKMVEVEAPANMNKPREKDTDGSSIWEGTNEYV